MKKENGPTGCVDIGLTPEFLMLRVITSFNNTPTVENGSENVIAVCVAVTTALQGEDTAAPVLIVTKQLLLITNVLMFIPRGKFIIMLPPTGIGFLMVTAIK